MCSDVLWLICWHPLLVSDTLWCSDYNELEMDEDKNQRQLNEESPGLEAKGGVFQILQAMEERDSASGHTEGEIPQTQNDDAYANDEGSLFHIAGSEIQNIAESAQMVTDEPVADEDPEDPEALERQRKEELHAEKVRKAKEKGNWQQGMMRWKAHSGGVFSCDYSPCGAELVTGGEDETVRIWRAQNGADLTTGVGHDWDITSVRCPTLSPPVTFLSLC